MADRADYPGYPEPRPEKKPNLKSSFTSKFKSVGIALLRGFVYLYTLIAASVKMVISGSVGAILALHFNRTIPEGLSSDTIWLLVLVLVVIFAVYHHVENDAKNTDLSSWD